MYDINNIITKENILEKISQEEIFLKYLGIIPEYNKFHINPYREDNNAGCRFYISDKTGMIKFKDFATGWNWDCFNIVQIKYNCNFQEAMEIIAQDFNFKNRTFSEQALKERERISLIKLNSFKPLIEIKERSFHKLDIQYWEQYGISIETLKFYKVYPIKKAWINKEVIYIDNDNDLGYCYYLGNKNYKLYFPMRDKKEGRPKFFHNNSNAIQGYYQLEPTGNVLIITKSMKDVMCMSNFGINSIALMAETIPLTDKGYNHFSNRFTNIATLLDRDYTGIKMTNLLNRKFNTTKLIFNKDDEKDFSDNFKKYGYQYMIDYIQEVKDILQWEE